MNNMRMNRWKAVRHFEAIWLIPNDETKDLRKPRRASLLLQERNRDN